ncbi:uncharacterized protein LOC106478571 [Limulus polyphemus]|uniref:Uncharacterized protein LOC106478571 n=1 Tax=Limulus polyphemus TaxID=6850 RepID=A0ABM1S2N9_LIMPO|nr:uncharacterized protein LOC106478571 [Limulus polyphemus]
MGWTTYILFLFNVIVSSHIHAIHGLRLQIVEVPTAVRRGDPIWLNCTYNLETDDLYSVKWYKNNVEFYRYLPSDDPPAQKYDLVGVYVELSKSYQGNVYLSSSDMNTEGTYRCEVSAEAPSFQTERAERELQIYVLPKGGPTIIGTKFQYHIGDEVNVTCHAAPSKPAATFKWYIHEEEVSPELLWHAPVVRYRDGLLSSQLGLHFIVKASHLVNGVLKLRCLADISQAYSMTSEEIIVGNTVRASGLYTAIDGPRIEGGLTKYQVGDEVDVNCTSRKSQKPAKLSWFINDKKANTGFVVPYELQTYPNGLKASLLGLKFVVRGHHFHKGEMRLKCTATLTKVIHTSSEEVFVGGNQQSSGLHVSENGSAVAAVSISLRQSCWITLTSLLLLCQM